MVPSTAPATATAPSSGQLAPSNESGGRLASGRGGGVVAPSDRALVRAVRSITGGFTGPVERSAITQTSFLARSCRVLTTCKREGEAHHGLFAGVIGERYTHEMGSDERRRNGLGQAKHAEFGPVAQIGGETGKGLGGATGIEQSR